ncbi:MAG: hydrogenase maturation nickel metallochaperone HypA [Clostridia bacterium]
MHEVSLMSEILAVVTAAAKERELARIHKIKLVVGELTSAMPDSLQFAFELLRREPVSEQAVLEIAIGERDEFFIEYIEGE